MLAAATRATARRTTGPIRPTDAGPHGLPTSVWGTNYVAVNAYTDVSYAYAAGESVKLLNTVVVGPPLR